MGKKKFYAVVQGIKPGVYDSWYGEDGAEVQIKGFPNARFQGFKTRIEAEEWLDECNRELSGTGDEIDDTHSDWNEK